MTNAHSSIMHPGPILLIAQDAAAGQGPSIPGVTGQSGAGPAQGPSSGSGGAGARSGGLGGGMLLLLLGVFVVMILMTSMSGRKERKKRSQMLASLGKGDKVQTVGGVIATVAEIRDDHLVLKVDDASGAKMKFAKSAVQQVLRSRNSPEQGQQVEAEPETQHAGV